jgi:quercetin dioxygenase-like cupin family protein
MPIQPCSSADIAAPPYHDDVFLGRRPAAGVQEISQRAVERVRAVEGVATMAIRHPIQRTPTEGRTIAVVGDIYRFLATSEETDGKYAMWEAIVPPGGGPPPHIHSREEESFFILEGEIAFQVGDEQIIARAGTFANMPVGSLHSFRNSTDNVARMIITVAPAGLERMFFEVGQPVALGDQVPPPTKAEIEKLQAVAPRYGVEIRVPGH